jgi:hypothetical protein
VLSLVAVKLESSTVTTAASSRGCEHPRFVTSNDVGDEVWAVFGTFLELGADSNTVLLLIFARHPWHKFCCYAPHVELIRQNELALSKRQSDNLAKVVNRSSLVFQDSLSQFATFSVMVPVEGRQQRPSSSTDSHAFLKRLSHSQVCVWPRALSPNAAFKHSVCFRNRLIEFDADRCPFTSFILAGRYDRKTALTQRHINAQ